jgi:recombinational DNA repair protein RecT
MSSFFPDLMISTSMMNSIVTAVEKDLDIDSSLFKAVRCPFRNAS